jgi:hypothetical protein
LAQSFRMFFSSFSLFELFLVVWIRLLRALL